MKLYPVEKTKVKAPPIKNSQFMTQQRDIKLFRNQHEWISIPEYFDSWILYFTGIKKLKNVDKQEFLKNKSNLTSKEQVIYDFFLAYFFQ